MTELEDHSMEIARERNFLTYLASAFPRGQKLVLLICLVLSFLTLLSLVYVISKQIEAEAAREVSFKLRKDMAAEVHITKIQNDTILHNQDVIILKLTQAELRGVISRIKVDSIISKVK